MLAESLLEISQKTHEDCGIKTYHVSYLPRRIYIEAPGIAEIQDFMKSSAYSHLVSRATRISDDDNRDFLQGTTVPNVPCPGSWIRIVQAGIYKGDLALVIFTPSEGDIVSIGVVPRFDVTQNKKRKGSGSFARTAPALLDRNFLEKFPLNNDNTYSIGSRMFLPVGLELLQAPSAHGLKIEQFPSDADLSLFQLCFERLNVTNKADKTEDLIWSAVKKAFRNESRRLWHTGDRVRILEGAFMDTLCSIQEIDEANQSAIVEFGWPTPTRVEVSMEDLVRQYLVGDQVRVALGKNKGRTGSILEITKDIATIIEGTANQIIEVTLPSILLHLLTILPSFKCYCCILRAIPQALLSLPLLIRRLHPLPLLIRLLHP
jgi:transcription antitermination factor NusG